MQIALCDIIYVSGPLLGDSPFLLVRDHMMHYVELLLQINELFVVIFGNVSLRNLSE